MSQNQNPDLGLTHLTPEDVRRLVIAQALAGTAIADKEPPGWLIERAFHLGDCVKERLVAEERGDPIKQWERKQRHEPGR